MTTSWKLFFCISWMYMKVYMKYTLYEMSTPSSYRLPQSWNDFYACSHQNKEFFHLGNTSLSYSTFSLAYRFIEYHVFCNLMIIHIFVEVSLFILVIYWTDHAQKACCILTQLCFCSLSISTSNGDHVSPYTAISACCASLSFHEQSKIRRILHESFHYYIMGDWNCLICTVIFSYHVVNENLNYWPAGPRNKRVISVV